MKQIAYIIFALPLALQSCSGSSNQNNNGSTDADSAAMSSEETNGLERKVAEGQAESNAKIAFEGQDIRFVYKTQSAMGGTPRLPIGAQPAVGEYNEVVVMRPWNEPYIFADMEFGITEMILCYTGDDLSYQEYHYRGLDTETDVWKSSTTRMFDGNSYGRRQQKIFRNDHSTQIAKELDYVTSTDGVENMYSIQEFTYDAQNRLTKKQTEYLNSDEGDLPILVEEYTYETNGTLAKSEIYKTDAEGTVRENCSVITYDAKGHRTEDTIFYLHGTESNTTVWEAEANDMGGVDTIMTELGRIKHIYRTSYDAEGRMLRLLMSYYEEDVFKGESEYAKPTPWTKKNSADTQTRVMGNDWGKFVVMTKFEGSGVKEYVRNDGEWLLMIEGQTEVKSADGQWEVTKEIQCPSLFEVENANWKFRWQK